MRNILVVLGLLSCLQAISQEYVKPLSFNPRLYYSTAKYHHHTAVGGKHKAFVMVEGLDSNLLVESDTLTLPFIDDFTYNLLMPYDFSPYIYDTVYNAIGSCDTFWPVSTVSDSFSLNQTYTYYFDTTTHQVDSTANAPIYFLNSPGFTGNCFYNMFTGDSAVLYPRGYLDVFDSLTGIATDSIFDTTNVVVEMTYAPVLYRAKMPAYAKWMDNNAWQNYTNPYLPPSIGVASFDGLNSQGLPYQPYDPTSWGQADVLTSKPINMSNLVDADSVYLSFFYQSGGFTDDPSVGDSLVLQFYNGYTNNWDEIWSVTGDSVPVAPGSTPDSFHQVILRIPSTSISPPIQYFYSGFQFRFLNYGSLSGDNDVWNLDYVRLDQGRGVVDTAIVTDIAFQYPFPSILKNYTEMPAEQFTGLADIVDTIPFAISNLNPSVAIGNPPATNYTVTATEAYPNNAVLLQTTSNTFNAGLENYLYLYPSTQYTAPTGGPPFDSLLITSQASLNNSDILPANDTITRYQSLTHTLAYDDGTAEFAYGVQNLGVNKFAYDFTLNQPDTLIGYQVMYANIDDDVSDLVVNWNLWYTLDTGFATITSGYMDSAVWSSNNATPQYTIDSVNGFWTYIIPPFPLPTHFYFGWVQDDTRNMQVGFDINSTKGFNHMYFYSSTQGYWGPSTLYLPGSPMIRLILGHTYQLPSAIKNTVINPVKVYPNPTSGIVTFELPQDGDTYTVQLYDMLGQISVYQTLGSGNNTINISNLSRGLYLLRLTDNTTGINYQNKIEKTNE